MAWRTGHSPHAARSRPTCGVIALAATVVLAALAGAPAGAQPATSSATATAPNPVVSDKAVREAVDKAVAYVLTRQDGRGAMPNRHSSEYVGGGEALAVVAMLWAGVDPADPRLARTMSYVAAQQPGHTYTRALRAMACSPPGDAQQAALLQEDVKWLLDGQLPSGGWGYGPRSAMARLRSQWTDASNSQMAMLALQMAADAGVDVPASTWEQAGKYWRGFRNDDGGWGYQPSIEGDPPQRGVSHGSMTAAALASLYILADEAASASQDGNATGGAPSDVALRLRSEIEGGSKWLADHYGIANVPGYVWIAQPSQLHYYLLALLRACQAGGLGELAGRDFAAEIGAALLARQRADGSWNGSLADTCLAILCLQKARAPVIVGRLRLGGPGGREPRDAANFTRRLALRLRTQLAWRSIGPGDNAALAAAPLLYVNPSAGERWPDALDDALASFLRSGGTCLVQAAADSQDFVSDFAARCRKALGNCRQGDVPGDHPIFNLPFPLAADQRPRVLGIGDGCRTRVLILIDDVSDVWRHGQAGQHAALFDLAGNIVYYATGGRMPEGRFSPAPPPLAPPPAQTIRVARLKHGGDWDACPLAVAKTSELLQHSRPIGLQEAPPADPDKPIDPAATLLWLTGNEPPAFTDAQLDNIRAYLRSGGTLLVDPATGRADFRRAAAEIIERLFDGAALAPLPADGELITGRFADGAGADLTKVHLLRDPAAAIPTGPAAWRMQPPPPRPAELNAIVLDGRIVVVTSAFGLACSAEGGPCLENVGYAPDDARRIIINVALYAAMRDR